MHAGLFAISWCWSILVMKVRRVWSCQMNTPHVDVHAGVHVGVCADVHTGVVEEYMMEVQVVADGAVVVADVENAVAVYYAKEVVN